MSTLSRERQRLLIVVVLLGVLFALRLLMPRWPWPYVAASLALIAAILTVVSEERRAFGDAYATPVERDAPNKVAARKWARNSMAIALAFVFFSAIVPVMELPRKDDLVRVGSRVNEVTFTDDDGNQRLNPIVLKGVLADLDTQIQAAMGRDPGAALWVQNCGMASPCACPAGYQPVPDSGEWNLNDKTPGSAIRLCSKQSLR